MWAWAREIIGSQVASSASTQAVKSALLVENLTEGSHLLDEVGVGGLVGGDGAGEAVLGDGLVGGLELVDGGAGLGEGGRGGAVAVLGWRVRGVCDRVE